MDDRLQYASKALRPLVGAFPEGRYWLVGGSVRDLFLNRTSFDYDIAVDANPADFAAAVARRTGGRPAPIGPEGRRIHRLVTDAGVFDFSRLVGSTIEEDLGRRDFTVNAMAFDPAEEKVIDPLAGRKDLAAGRIRMVSEQVFIDDPLRLVRAFRMSAVLKMALEPETESCIRRFSGLIQNSAGERVRDELYKMLAVEESNQTIGNMYRCGLLGQILPELTALKGCSQNDHHQHDVLTHTLQVFSHLESMMGHTEQYLSLRRAAPAFSEMVVDPVPLKLAALLHDIGKPEARGKAGNGKVHFRGHPRIGYRAAMAVFERLRLSNRHRQFIGFLIRHHIRPLQLFIAHREGRLTRKGRTRFFLRCGKMTPSLLLLALADMAGKKTPPGERFSAFTEFVEELADDYFHNFRPKKAEPPLLDGRDLIEEVGLSPSPMFGKILSRIEAERLEGRLRTRDAALARARGLAAEHGTDRPAD